MAVTIKKAPIDWTFDYFKLAADPWPTNAPTGTTVCVYDPIALTGVPYVTPDDGATWIADSTNITLGAADLAVIAAQCAAALAAVAYTRQAGVMQVFNTTIDLYQAAGTYDLATRAIQDCLIESVIVALPNINVSDDATITSISVQTNDSTAQVFIDGAVEGLKANLAAEAQIASSLSSPILLRNGKKIQLTIAGGAADASPTKCDVTIIYEAAVSGGYLT